MALLLALVLLGSAVGAFAQEEIETEYGTIRGKTVNVHLASGDVEVSSFYGIPYASPPTGNLRFEPPQKAQTWEGVLDTTTLPNMCMQNPIGIMFMTHPLWSKYDEDCLFVNIVKPKNVFGILPVFVWFHGGGYTGGGNIQYPGHFLAARDAVVVTVNYRLGVFGFASTPDRQINGNMGMLDQVMALQFVKDNIEKFGGNPNKVTIFGQSAGASSSALHMVSPKSKGLFNQAILESGAESNIWTLNFPSQDPDQYIYQVADNAGCPKEDITEMITCLRALPQRQLRIFDEIVCTPGTFCQGFAPIVDSPDGFMPDLPINLREQLKEQSVPTIGGICRKDGSLYTIYFIPEANDGGFTREEFEYYLRTRLIDIYEPGMTPEQYEQAYNAMDYQYAPHPYLDDLEGNRQAFNELLTDAGFGYAWDRNAKINSQYARTYTYVQSFLSLNSTSFIPEWMGVPHNGELAYVWGYGYLLINPDVRNDSGIYFDLVGWTPEDMPYSDYVQTLWKNFAAVGNPTPTPIKAPFNDTLTTWPAYSWDDGLKVLDLDAEIKIMSNYKQKEYAFFTHYAPTIVGRPVKTSAAAKPKSKKTFQLRSSMFQREITKMVERMLTERFPGEYEEKLAELKRQEGMKF